MALDLGAFAKRLAGKATAAIVTKARERVLKAASAKLNQQAAEEYRSEFFDGLIRASMAEVLQAVERYRMTHLYGWSLQPTIQSSDGRTVELRFIREHQEVFQLGQMGQGLEIRSAALGIIASHLQSEGRTQPMAVLYRFTLQIKLDHYFTSIGASVSMQEDIDPHGSVHYIQSGQIAVPSRVHVRTGNVSAENLKQFLYETCHADRPNLETWFREKGHKIPRIAETIKEVENAQEAFDQAKQGQKEPG
jgi:hypothetical protein